MLNVCSSQVWEGCSRFIDWKAKSCWASSLKYKIYALKNNFTMITFSKFSRIKLHIMPDLASIPPKPFFIYNLAFVLLTFFIFLISFFVFSIWFLVLKIFHDHPTWNMFIIIMWHTILFSKTQKKRIHDQIILSFVPSLPAISFHLYLHN